MVVPNWSFEQLREVQKVVLVHLSPKITSVGHRSAPLCPEFRLSGPAYNRLYTYFLSKTLTLNQKK